MKNAINKPDLTICSVSFYSKIYLETNKIITSKLNKQNTNYQWLIIDNTPGFADKNAMIEDEQCRILEGTLPDISKPIECRGSYHHAASLNKALEYVSTRFLLILDPDFYIVREGWIDEIISYMLSKKLSFFGVPWHPRWRGKYRYFPCVHCLFIDLEKIPIQHIDFIPGIHLLPPPKYSSKTKKKLSKLGELEEAQTEEINQPIFQQSVELKQSLPDEQLLEQPNPHNIPTLMRLASPSRLIIKPIKKFTKHWKKQWRSSRKQWNTLKTQLRKRLRKSKQELSRAISIERRKEKIGSSPDTGYKIYEQYGRNGKAKAEYTTPVYKPTSDPKLQSYVTSWENRLIEIFLPDSLCHIPKRRNYFSQVGFRELGYPDVMTKDWEEFVWQGKPFGFHIRCNKQNALNAEQMTAILTDILEQFTSAVSKPE